MAHDTTRSPHRPMPGKANTEPTASVPAPAMNAETVLC